HAPGHFSASLRCGMGRGWSGHYSFFFNTAEAFQSRQVRANSDSATDKQPRIAVPVVRRARASSTPPLDARGGSSFFMDAPASSDVISFEFPAMPAATESLLKGHTFSLRIRVTPVAK